MSALLEVENLQSFFFTRKGLIKAVDDVSFAIESGQTLALVGESGCGKSMTALSLLRLLPEPGRVVGGDVRFQGQDLLHLPLQEMRRIRGNRVSMIFQEPMTSLNPVFRIGEQISEVLELHNGMNRSEAIQEAEKLLIQVGIGDPARRLRDYPHQLSGGQRQRVMIAMALACSPQLLIADEPTTALDVTIQAQIMDLLDRLKEQHRMATLLISHDLGVVANHADHVCVMYSGIVVEQAPVEQLFANPSHPYTRGLLECIPRIGRKGPLSTIKGQVPAADQVTDGCSFLERCPAPFAPCGSQKPPLTEIEPGHFVRCWRN